MRAKGLEPLRLSAPDPKSGVSTNSTTLAAVATKGSGRRKPRDWTSSDLPGPVNKKKRGHARQVRRAWVNLFLLLFG